MTPDDLAERRHWDSAAWRHRDIVALMDALDEAVAGRSADADEWIGVVRHYRERAERAEAEVREARAEATFSRAAENAIGTQNIAYRAALARVRDVAYGLATGALPDTDVPGMIRAALDGM